ncbi:PspA/IM30 family protein [Rhodococcus indonesiensis]
MTTDPSAPDPDAPAAPVPDVTPAEPGSPSVPDVTPAEPGSPSVPDVPASPVGPDVTPAEGEDSGYTPAGVPTFDSVREKIERRAGTAIGAEELARESVAGRTLEEQFDERRQAAAGRLREIRRSLAQE